MAIEGAYGMKLFPWRLVGRVVEKLRVDFQGNSTLLVLHPVKIIDR